MWTIKNIVIFTFIVYLTLYIYIGITTVHPFKYQVIAVHTIGRVFELQKDNNYS